MSIRRHRLKNSLNFVYYSFHQKNSNHYTMRRVVVYDAKNDRTIELVTNNFEWSANTVSQLANLRHLNLRDNLLTTLPASFIQLSKLQSLDLKANDLQSLPPNFHTLPALRELTLSMNLKLPFEAQKLQLQQMPQLTFLDLSYNNITKPQIETLRTALPNCTVVNWDYKK